MIVPDSFTNSYKQSLLPTRWARLKYHPEQHRLFHSDIRFAVIPSGRRSGKTELSKRKGVLMAIRSRVIDYRIGYCAPTREQVKRIYWNDLKRMIPRILIAHINETELIIQLVHGPEIWLIGMDKPERAEGGHFDWLFIDEYGNMKPKAWGEHLRPTLSTPGRVPGGAWFLGVPEGRNHYYKTYKRAKGKRIKDWDVFHWISADIIDHQEILDAQRDLDRLTYLQEYEGSFLNFEGRAYYGFDEDKHSKYALNYNPRKDLIFCFDFNVAPGVAVVCQEFNKKKDMKRKMPGVAENFTGVIGEVWIPQNSNTPAVCRRLVKDWAHHTKNIYLYGDATGGAKGTAKIGGSDWDLIRQYLDNSFGGNRIKEMVGRSNPREKVRVNAMNARIESFDETISMLVDPDNAPHVCEDLEGVTFLEGGSGEIDKDSNSDLTHLTDALGYYIADEFPIEGGVEEVAQQF